MKNFNENVCSFLFAIIIAVGMFFAFLYATSAECWYAGMHDSKHEGNGACHCYERFIQNEKVCK